MPSKNKKSSQIPSKFDHGSNTPSSPSSISSISSPFIPNSYSSEPTEKELLLSLDRWKDAHAFELNKEHILKINFMINVWVGEH